MTKPSKGGLLNLKYGCRSRTRTYDPLINSMPNTSIFFGNSSELNRKRA